MSAVTCSWCVWLRACGWIQMTWASSSDSRMMMSDAACFSCSSGSVVAEDAHLRLVQAVRFDKLCEIFLKLNQTWPRFPHSDPQLPPGQTGCSASMLGLHPVTPSHLLNVLKASIWILRSVSFFLLQKNVPPPSVVCFWFFSVGPGLKRRWTS